MKFNLNSLTKQVGLGYALILSIFAASLVVTLQQLDNIEVASNQVKNLRGPTARSSLMLLNGINHSLAALRGWMLIGNESGGEKFKIERKKAWTDEIIKSIEEMNLLSTHWTNPENIERLRIIKASLKEFERHQNEIEKIANSDINREASRILFTEAAPRAAVLTTEIMKMIEIEKSRKSSDIRKKILGIMADIQGSMGLGLANIRAFLLSGNNKFKLAFEKQWKINNARFVELTLNKQNLNKKQLLALEKTNILRVEFSQLPKKIFTIRGAKDWNRAKYILRKKAAPLAFEIKTVLNKMVKNQDKLQNQDYINVQNETENLKWLLSILLLMGILMSIFVSLSSIKGVKVPINDLIKIITGMSKGKFDLAFKEYNISEISLLTESVQKMKDYLLKKNKDLETEKIRLEKEDWIKSNLAAILETLPGHTDLNHFANELLNSLMPKINGLVGAFYIKDVSAKNITDGASDSGTLSLSGSYAHPDGKNNSKKIYPGKGLAGQCALEQKTRYISEIPDDYMPISSSLGETKSKHIVLAPVSYEGEVLGLIEIASLEKFSTINRNLIDQVLKNIGIILKSVLGRIETEKLLDFVNLQNKEKEVLADEMILVNKNLAAQKEAMDEHSLVSVTDTKGNILYANDKFCAVSGYNRDELIDKNHRLLNSANQSKAYWHEMYQEVAKGGVWHDEVRNKAKDGHFYWVDTTIVPLYDAYNKLSGYTSIRTDITHQKEIIDNLAETKKQAEIANESKTDFLANMSHEIRTPINGVIGMTNLLLDTPLSEEQQTFAKTVKSSAKSLLAIINDILDFSKVEAGKLELESIDFDMGLLLHESGRTLYHHAEDKGLELICPATPVEHQWFSADAGRIRQVINNLVGNAIKFTARGEVAVYYSVLENEKTQNQTASQTKLLIEVIDTGIGLSEAQQAKLFKRFSQADGSTTRKYGGTGLGLSISKQLVKLMGGEIGVKSVEGKGSTFWFTLALNNATVQRPLETFNSLHDQKVLVVDDNLTNRTLLGQLMSSWQVEHTLTKNKEEALECLRAATAKEHPYHIVILDMQKDGTQLGAEIKKDSDLSSTGLIILTSQGKHDDVEKFKAAGFEGYLSKPVDQSILYNTLLQVADITVDDQQLVTAYTSRKMLHFTARILIVEDNTINQMVAQGMLFKFGIQVDLAANGVEAVHALENWPYDLVFMDCQMPVMDGFDATRMIRSPESKALNPVIPIVAMTANAMQGDREKCFAAGMDDFISKPVDPDKLQQALQQWLPKKALGKAPKKEMPALPSEKKIAPQEPIFDYVAMGNRLMNDKDLIHTVAKAFISDMTQQIALLKTAVANEDCSITATQSHKIKGAAINVGGIALSSLAHKMECAGKAEEIETMNQVLSKLEHEFILLKTAIEKIL